MKILKKTQTETLITGVEFTLSEFMQKLKDSEVEISFELPVAEDDWNKEWGSAPDYDTWVAAGNTVTITFNNEDEDLPRYVPPKVISKKKVTNKK